MISNVRKPQLDQISLILACIAFIEGWDAQHESIESKEDGSWKFLGPFPKPSQQLLDEIHSRIENIKKSRREVGSLGVK